MASLNSKPKEQLERFVYDFLLVISIGQAIIHIIALISMIMTRAAIEISVECGFVIVSVVCLSLLGSNFLILKTVDSIRIKATMT